jgi:hypothetical protein
VKTKKLSVYKVVKVGLIISSGILTWVPTLNLRADIPEPPKPRSVKVDNRRMIPVGKDPHEISPRSAAAGQQQGNFVTDFKISGPQLREALIVVEDGK